MKRKDYSPKARRHKAVLNSIYSMDEYQGKRKKERNKQQSKKIHNTFLDFFKDNSDKSLSIKLTANLLKIDRIKVREAVDELYSIIGV